MAKAKLALIVAAIAFSAVAFTASAFAAGKSGTTKPGWGFGDKNHVHTGPPGQTVRP